jgi:hypothetical protein
VALSRCRFGPATNMSLPYEHFSFWCRFADRVRPRITLFVHRIFDPIISSPSVTKLTS